LFLPAVDTACWYQKIPDDREYIIYILNCLIGDFSSGLSDNCG
jgi:hypothetical protein